MTFALGIQTMAATALSAADIQAICRCLKLPLPTPDISIDNIIQANNLTALDVITRLERCTDLDAMIAAATLRGVGKKMPPDMKLTPKPYPKAPVKAPKTEEEAKRAAPVTPPVVRSDGTRVLLHVAPNPKRPGSSSRDRYALYEAGLTEAELIKKGILPADIRWDTQREFLKWKEAS